MVSAMPTVRRGAVVVTFRDPGFATRNRNRVVRGSLKAGVRRVSSPLAIFACQSAQCLAQSGLSPVMASLLPLTIFDVA